MISKRNVKETKRMRLKKRRRRARMPRAKTLKTKEARIKKLMQRKTIKPKLATRTLPNKKNKSFAIINLSECSKIHHLKS
jgi:hypothetical protein